MRGRRIEKEVDICATNLINETKRMSTVAKKWETNLWRHVVSTTFCVLHTIVRTL
jgi:hypothetical protein